MASFEFTGYLAHLQPFKENAYFLQPLTLSRPLQGESNLTIPCRVCNQGIPIHYASSAKSQWYRVFGWSRYTLRVLIISIEGGLLLLIPLIIFISLALSTGITMPTQILLLVIYAILPILLLFVLPLTFYVRGKKQKDFPHIQDGKPITAGRVLLMIFFPRGGVPKEIDQTHRLVLPDGKTLVPTESGRPRQLGTIDIRKAKSTILEPSDGSSVK